MNAVLTFVTSSLQNPLKNSHFDGALKILSSAGVTQAGDIAWLSPEKAADLPISKDTSSAKLCEIRDFLHADKIDLFINPPQNRRKKLLLADMDSTIVTGETLDDLAEYAGIKNEIANITARAMNGELDFHEALFARVALLTGLGVEALHKTLAHTTLSAGAQTLVQTMKAHGATCVLVSGGFTFFTGDIAQKVGFDHHHGNILDVADGRLCGTVTPPILDKFAKVEFLEHYRRGLGLGLDSCMSIGDGANDIPMLKSAGLGVGYHPKPAVATTVDNLILHGDLTAALYAQGYTDHEFS